MSISRRFAVDQVKRLAGTEYFSALSDEAVRELQRAVGSAPNEAIAILVVNEWVETQQQRPTPADLYRLIEKHKPKTLYWEPNYPPPEPVSDEERAEIDAFARKLAERAEAKKLGRFRTEHAS